MTDQTTPGLSEREAFLEALVDVQPAFLALTDVRGYDECWTWKGTTRNGYGQFCTEKVPGMARQSIASRVAWIFANKRLIPEGLVVRHTCDNPPCVNPAHLILGTMADNSADMKARNRASRANRPCYVVSPEAKDFIRRSTEGHALVGRFLGVDPKTVRYWRLKFAKEAANG